MHKILVPTITDAVKSFNERYDASIVFDEEEFEMVFGNKNANILSVLLNGLTIDTCEVDTVRRVISKLQTYMSEFEDGSFESSNMIECLEALLFFLICDVDVDCCMLPTIEKAIDFNHEMSKMYEAKYDEWEPDAFKIIAL